MGLAMRAFSLLRAGRIRTHVSREKRETLLHAIRWVADTSGPPRCTARDVIEGSGFRRRLDAFASARAANGAGHRRGLHLRESG